MTQQHSVHWRNKSRAMHVFSVVSIIIPLSVCVAALLLGAKLQNFERVSNAPSATPLAYAVPALPHQAISPNFALRLPVSLDVHDFLDHLETSCNSRAVVLESVSTWQSAPTQQVMGRNGFSVNLKGSYTQLKAVLAEALDRSPNLLVQRLEFKRGA